MVCVTNSQFLVYNTFKSIIMMIIIYEILRLWEVNNDLTYTACMCQNCKSNTPSLIPESVNLITIFYFSLSLWTVSPQGTKTEL